MNTQELEQNVIDLLDRAIQLANEERALIISLLEGKAIQDYLANGGDPKDLSKQNGTSGLPADGSLPF
jgi:hypothetical protein